MNGLIRRAITIPNEAEDLIKEGFVKLSDDSVVGHKKRVCRIPADPFLR
jgi:hypothetical protein